MSGWVGSAGELGNYPALAVYGAWIRVLTGRPAEAEQWLALAEGATSKIPLSDGSATIAPWVATLRSHMMRTESNGRSLTPIRRSISSSASGWLPVALLGVVSHMLCSAQPITQGTTSQQLLSAA